LALKPNPNVTRAGISIFFLFAENSCRDTTRKKNAQQISQLLARTQRLGFLV